MMRSKSKTQLGQVTWAYDAYDKNMNWFFITLCKSNYFGKKREGGEDFFSTKKGGNALFSEKKLGPQIFTKDALITHM